ncbi:YncE family protein [Lentzea sp. NPDC059081]|uniref:YncE family protein n=1 Tax=Lentzea sp. NPDC059081 TaxID=3346719 RepID=UPI0036AEC79C
MRRLAALLLTTAALAACGQSESSQDPLQVAETLEAAKPALSPAQNGTPAGAVTPGGGFTEGDTTRKFQVNGRDVELDRLRSAVFEMTKDDKGTEVRGTGLRAGDGATNAVPDRYGRLLVVDTRGGEFLAFSINPLIMRQRYPVPGSPYGIAYDAKRDIAWITLTERNEVVGLDVAGGEPTEKHRFPTVRQPNTVSVDQETGRVTVTSGDNGGVQVISP